MKKALIILLFSIFTISCVNKEKESETDEFESIGTITNRDMALCACCGGWIIEIDGEEESDMFVELPNSSMIDLETVSLPIEVELNWHNDDSTCDFIIIDEIQVVE